MFHDEHFRTSVHVPWHNILVHSAAYCVLQATITAQFDHPNIVRLVGVVTAGAPLMIVLEVCFSGQAVWSATLASNAISSCEAIDSFISEDFGTN